MSQLVTAGADPPDKPTAEAQLARARKRVWLSVGGLVSISLFNLIVAMVAVVYSARSYEIARGTAEAQQFTQLRQRLYEVQDRLPPDADQLDRGPERGTKEWASFRAYWEQAYTEWHVTNKVSNGQFRPLWDDFYEPVFRSVITRPAFRDTAADLLTHEFTHGPRKEFAEILRRFHREQTGRELARG